MIQRVLLAALAALTLGHHQALGQVAASGTSLRIDPSIRSAGMGGASSAVFWGEGPNTWANPALLGSHRGIRYQWSRTQLVPDLADDVTFTSNRLSLGEWGLGWSLAGEPGKVGGERLDYGENVITDFSGNVIAVYEPYEQVRSWGVGVNLLEFTTNLIRGAGNEGPDLARYGDVALGYASKNLEVRLSPEVKSEATNRDRGILIRLSPYNSIDHETMLGRLDALGGLRFDLAFAWAELNRDDASLRFIDPDQSEPLAKERRRGLALRVETGFPEDWKTGLPGWTRRILSSLISFGATWDRRTFDIPGATPEWKVRQWGLETTVASLLTLRIGHVKEEDVIEAIDGMAWGLGAGFDMEGVGGFRYDYANSPQAPDLKDLSRHGITGYVNVMGLLQQ